MWPLQGLGLAIACDLVYAAETASFEWAYHKTGLTGAESSTFFLPRLVGFRTAMGIMLLNPRLSASDAKSRGLVTDVFPPDRLDADVMAITHCLAKGPTRAYGVAKHLINQSAGVDRLDTHLDEELRQLVRIAEGGDFAEGLTAFLEKRAPRFRGQD